MKDIGKIPLQYIVYVCMSITTFWTNIKSDLSFRMITVCGESWRSFRARDGVRSVSYQA